MIAKSKTTVNQNETVVLLRPENNNKKYEALFLDIDSGQIKLPMFQREFVWDKEQSSKLIDSILKGYLSVHDLLTQRMNILFKQVGAEYSDLIEDYKSRLTLIDAASNNKI